jgi:hypothetical protein
VRKQTDDSTERRERRRSLPEVRHKNALSIVRTMLWNWKVAWSCVQELWRVGRDDRLPQFPRSHAVALGPKVDWLLIIESSEKRLVELELRDDGQIHQPIPSRKVSGRISRNGPRLFAIAGTSAGV